ncbi:MAG: ABC transporter permease [Gammaproteobacteria bacterium]|nr:MAG: ABC transporter permease [Gammaproteobacteria bacterium]
MLRDPRARGALILPPIIQLFIFSSAATMEVKNIALAIVDLDRGPYAADVEQRLSGSRSFTRLPRYANVAGARVALDREQVVGILVLPSGFSPDLAAGRPASAQLLLDGRRSNAAQIRPHRRQRDAKHGDAPRGCAGHHLQTQRRGRHRQLVQSEPRLSVVHAA